MFNDKWQIYQMYDFPVKNVTGIFSCLFDGSLIENETQWKSNGNPIIFLANAMEISWLELVQNPCHIFSIDNRQNLDKWHGIVMEFGVKFDQAAVDLWRQFGRKWDQIRWKSHHFLSKCHGNSMTWTCPKSMSCLSM